MLALAALVLALAACEKSAAATPVMMERPPAPVQAATAVARDVPVYLDEIGRAVASETVWVRAQVAGRIEAVHFADGADLKKGELLFTIDARPFEARLAAAEASVLRAQADLARAKTAVLRPHAALARAIAARDLAKDEFARVEGLVGTRAVSRADYDARKSAVAMAEAEVKQAEADVEQAGPEEAQALADLRKAEADVVTARLDVEYCTVKSPLDGRAGQRLVDAGNLIAATGSPLVMIERLDPVYVDFNVSERELPAVQRNMARGKLRAEVTLPDARVARAEPHVGELTFVDNVVQEGAGTVKLRATFPNADRHFWPGQFVDVRLVLSTLPGAVLVPATAPQLSAGGTFIYVVKDDGTAEMRPTSLGQRQGDLVVVSEGVKGGERVVTAGQLAVTPGGKVRVEGDAAAASPAPAAGTPR